MRILIIDTSSIAQRIEELLSDFASVLDIKSCSSINNVLDILFEFEPDIVVLDIIMPNRSGMQLVRYMNAVVPHTKVIILTNYRDEFYKDICLKLGAVDYLDKTNELDIFSELVKDLYFDSLTKPIKTNNALSASSNKLTANTKSSTLK